jgi:ribose transport system substrate-binding protein
MHEKSIFRTVNQCVSPRRRLAVLCAGIAAAVLTGGCSSAGGGSSTSSAGTAPLSGAASNCVATATAHTQAAMAPMKLGTPNQVDGSAMKGKTFAVIDLTFTPATVPEGDAMQQALATVGAKTIIFDGQGEPDVVAQDFQAAIAQHAAGIVTLGIDPTTFPSAYASAKAANVPVVAANTGDPQAALAGGVAALVTVDATQIGTLQADYALAHTDCKLHAAVIYASTSKNTVYDLNGVTAEVKKLCPTDCSVDPVSISVATFPTTLAGQVQTTLQHSPDINYLLSTSDSFNPYMIQGRKALGSQVPIIGAQGSGLAAAIAGDGVTVDVMWPPNAVVGYYFADAIMGAAASAPKNQALPLRLVDSSNWGTSATVNAQYPDLAGYQAAFKKAWGL